MSPLCAHCQSETPGSPPGLLTMAEVEAIVPFCKRTIQRMVKDESFPQPVRFGKRALLFLEAEVHAWLAGQIASRNTSEGNDD
jgi:prophage regulatory protein